MNRLFTILAVLLLLPALGASETFCHDAHGSLAFDDVMDLVAVANDAAITRFAYDDGHRVTRAETLIGSAASGATSSLKGVVND